MSTLLCSIHRQLLHLPDMSPIPHHVLHVSHVTEHLCPHSHQFWLEFLPSRSMTLSHPPSSIEILVLCVSLHLRGGRFPLWCPGAVGSDWHLHAPDLQNFLPGGCDQGMYHRPPGLLLVGIVKNHALNALVLDWLSFLDVSIDPRIDSLVLQHHSQQILQLGNFTVSLVHLLCPPTIPLFGPLLPSFCLLSTAFFFALFSSSDTEYSSVYSTWYSIETLWHSSESSSRVSHLYKFIRSLFVLDASINDLFIPVFAYILLYSILPHKELRFIFPILPLFTCIAAGMNLLCVFMLIVGMSRLWTHRSKSSLITVLISLYTLVRYDIGHLEGMLIVSVTSCLCSIFRWTTILVVLPSCISMYISLCWVMC